MVAVTVFVEVSITDTVPGELVLFVTYAKVPAGFTATPVGPLPTVTVAVTVLLEVSMTETLLEPRLAA